MRYGFRKLLIAALGGIFLASVSSCSKEKLSDNEVIANFIEYANKEDFRAFVDEDNDNALTILKEAGTTAADNQVVVMGYNSDASDAFQEALLEEFFDNKDNRLMDALINKNMTLRVVFSGKVVSSTTEFSPEQLESYRRRK